MHHFGDYIGCYNSAGPNNMGNNKGLINTHSIYVNTTTCTTLCAYTVVFVKCHFSTNCVDANDFVNTHLNRLLVIFLRNY